MSAKKRILVVGAGASGLTSIKACKEENFDVVCCEKSGDFGGVWRYHESDVDGLPSVMKSTISNTSKEMSSFSDFPPPREFPMYLHHILVLKYLELYAEHFDLLSSIHYYEEVTEMVPAEDYGTTGKWIVKIRNLNRDETREETFDGVMVCTGHHAYPNMPTYSGIDLYTGKVMHSHSYKTFTGFEDKTVLVVGAGNSGCDVAVELSRVAKKVYLSTRRGVWVYPRTVEKGKPIAAVLLRRCRVLQPPSLAEYNMKKLLNSVMDHKRFGIRPHHKISGQHPTINENLLPMLAAGEITVKKDIKEFTENGAKFDGEDEVALFDTVVFATGYTAKFPFLNEDILKVGKNGKVSLYKGVFPPQLKHPSLALIGLLQPHGPLFPVFEIQARWFISVMAGKCSLPSCDEMLGAAKKVDDFRARNYVQSPRHAVDLPWIPYMDDIAELVGAKPNLTGMLMKDPKLFWACFKKPLLPYQFRLIGPHKWNEAREAILSYKSRLYAYLSDKAE